LSEGVIKALGPRGASGNGWVFPSSHASSGHISNVANQWRWNRKSVGLDPAVELYCCRHTFSTDALRMMALPVWSVGLIGDNDNPF